MSRQYHYLIAGFPDLFFDDSKSLIKLEEFRQLLTENLPETDMEIIRLYFNRFDNRNILARLKDENIPFDHRGNFTESDLDDLFEAVKEGADNARIQRVPAFYPLFIGAFKSELPVYDGKSWDNQLTELYYKHVIDNNNSFVSNWFLFERDFQNIVTASQCRKHRLPADNQLIGTGELIDKLSRSSARDFGIDNDFPMIDQILKVIEEDDIKEFEKKIDRIKWDFLDNEIFFYYFTIEKLFSFIVKLSIAERWLSLDKEVGKEFFEELLKNLEAAYQFPEEFM